VLEMLATDVQYAKEKIASYQQLVTPQPVNLFDIYQALQKVMEDIEILGCPQEHLAAMKEEFPPRYCALSALH
jgi:hypothetical protein